jgi:hypothetical protein
MNKYSSFNTKMNINKSDDPNYKFREGKAKIIKIIRRWNSNDECIHDSSYNLFRWVNKFHKIIKSKEDIIEYLRSTDEKLYAITESQIYENVEILFYQDCCKNFRKEFDIEGLIHEDDDDYQISENGSLIRIEKQKIKFEEDDEEFEEDSNSDEPIDLDEEDIDYHNYNQTDDENDSDFEANFIKSLLELNMRFDPEEEIPYDKIPDKDNYIHRLCARIQFKNIIRGGTYFDIAPKYIMKWIITWIYDYNDIIKCQEEINKIIYDYENNVVIKKIVNDIFYDEYYKKLREDFDIMDGDIK